MNDGKPFFTVIIPVYNKGPHIARSISSVLRQTFLAFELILVNDASSDDSLEEIQKFTDPRIRILHRDQPGPGGYAARNLGIADAKAEWVAFLDADDEWCPEHLEKMHQLSKQFPDVYFMGCGWNCSDGSSSYHDGYYAQNYNRGNHDLDTRQYLRACLKNIIPVRTSFACVRVGSPMAKNLFPAEKDARRGGDLHAWLKLICRHKKMAWSAHVGGKYFNNSVNMVTKTAPTSPCLMSREVYNELSCHLDHKERKLLKSYLNIRLRNAWVYNLKRGNLNFSLFPKVYWSGDIVIALRIISTSFFQSLIMKPLFIIKKGLK